MKKQGNDLPPKMCNSTEVDEISDKELKILTVKMIKEIKEEAPEAQVLMVMTRKELLPNMSQTKHQKFRTNKKSCKWLHGNTKSLLRANPSW